MEVYLAIRLHGSGSLTIVGIGSLVAAWGLLTRRSWGPDAALGAGIILTGWIVIEMLLLRMAHRLQLLCFGIGLITAGLAWRVRSTQRSHDSLREARTRPRAA